MKKSVKRVFISRQEDAEEDPIRACDGHADYSTKSYLIIVMPIIESSMNKVWLDDISAIFQVVNPETESKGWLAHLSKTFYSA